MGRKAKPKNIVPIEVEDINISVIDELDKTHEDEITEQSVEQVIEPVVTEEIVKPAEEIEDRIMTATIFNISNDSLRFVLSDKTNIQIPFRGKILVAETLLSKQVKLAEAQKRVIVVLSKGE